MFPFNLIVTKHNDNVNSCGFVLQYSQGSRQPQYFLKGDYMNNLEIRMKIREKRLCHYEVASAIGVSEYTFCRWLRDELSEEKKNIVLRAIESISLKGGEHV